MPIQINIPTPLRKITNGLKTVQTEGRTVAEVLLALEDQFPEITGMLYDKKTGRAVFNIYLNDEEIRVLNNEEARYEIDLNHPVKDGDSLFIIPPIAGGIGH